MATLTDMISRISDEMVNDGDISTAQITYAIQDAIKQYERRSWWFNQKRATLSTVATQEYYTSTDLADIPNIVQIDNAVCALDGVKTPVLAIDYNYIDDIQDGSVVGQPTALAVYTNSIRLYPIPDAVYPVTLSYVYRLTTLTDGSQTNAWTTEAEELIRQSAKRRIAVNYLEADDLAARFAAMEGEAFTAMLAENRRRRPNTILQVPQMLGPNTFNIITGN